MIEAVVEAGGHETTYRRAGAGAAVVLLSGAEDAVEAEWLFEALAGRFRTIAPDLPPDADDADADPATLERWLRGFIDGLGLERPAVVAGTRLGAAVLRFATLDPDRVDRVALLERVPGADEPEARAVALEELLGFLARVPAAQTSAPTFRLS